MELKLSDKGEIMKLYAKTFSELSAREIYEILKSRMEIFLLEQNIKCLDTDDVDYDSLHVFFENEGRVVAYFRAFEHGEGTVKIKAIINSYESAVVDFAITKLTATIATETAISGSF